MKDLLVILLFVVSLILFMAAFVAHAKPLPLQPGDKAGKEMVKKRVKNNLKPTLTYLILGIVCLATACFLIMYR